MQGHELQWVNYTIAPWILTVKFKYNRPIRVTHMGIAEDLKLLLRGVDEVISEGELVTLLQSGKKLRVKVGFDPTAPDLHLGHTVLINKARHFQDLGHEVLFLIGDFTAMIGDPSGRSVMRKPLTREEVLANSETYCEQFGKILDKDKTTLVFNSAWMDDLPITKLVELASTHTVARMLERDDFEKRYKSNQPIAIHEFLYPLFMGYDSVVLDADIELGGVDQKFNLLMGRELQKHYGKKPQVVMTLPLLEGLDGVKKMSKSQGNYIGISDTPHEMFGKLMSVSDELMWRYFELLSFKPTSEIEKYKSDVAGGANPRDIKVALAQEIITRFHSKAAADEALEDFELRFKQGGIPEDIEEKTVKAPTAGWGLPNVLKEVGLVSSTSEGMRMIAQNAVKIDGRLSANKDELFMPGFEGVIQVGKRKFMKVTLK